MALSGPGGRRMYPPRDFPGREAAALGGAFRDNVPWLLKQWSPATDGVGPSAWRALLSDDRTGAIVPILAVEELAAPSPAPLCDCCRCAGTVPFLTFLPSSPLENDWNGRASITLPAPAAAFVPTQPLQGLGLSLLRLHAYMISKKKYIYTIDDDCFEVDGKKIQIQLTGFMEKNTVKFTKELWSLLLFAQKNASGVPQQFLDAKEA